MNSPENTSTTNHSTEDSDMWEPGPDSCQQPLDYLEHYGDDEDFKNLL